VGCALAVARGAPTCAARVGAVTRQASVPESCGSRASRRREIRRSGFSMDNDLKSYSSVQKWIRNVNQMFALSESEWNDRLQVLAEFCAHVGKNPDEIIEDALEEKGQKVDFMRRLREGSKLKFRDPVRAHEWQNVVRSFFIHNGARVVVRTYPQGTT